MVGSMKPKITEHFERVFLDSDYEVYYDNEFKRFIIYGGINVYYFMYLKKRIKYSGYDYKDIVVV